jgi:uncharacterized membrane-anchored protein YhcB (DUF1043 family)
MQHLRTALYHIRASLKKLFSKSANPTDKLNSEMKALRFFNSRSSVCLLKADEEHDMFLLERLRPYR